MKIVVVNGSPKGKYSITLQTVHYLEIKYPDHEFSVIHAGQKIKTLEKDFSKASDLLESADAILFFISRIHFSCTVTAPSLYRAYEGKRCQC